MPNYFEGRTIFFHIIGELYKQNIRPAIFFGANRELAKEYGCNSEDFEELSEYLYSDIIFKKNSYRLNIRIDLYEEYTANLLEKAIVKIYEWEGDKMLDNRTSSIENIWGKLNGA